MIVDTTQSKAEQRMPEIEAIRLILDTKTEAVSPDFFDSHFARTCISTLLARRLGLKEVRHCSLAASNVKYLFQTLSAMDKINLSSIIETAG